jgi:hypothetical protein
MSGQREKMSDACKHGTVFSLENLWSTDVNLGSAKDFKYCSSKIWLCIFGEIVTRDLDN